LIDWLAVKFLGFSLKTESLKKTVKFTPLELNLWNFASCTFTSAAFSSLVLWSSHTLFLFQSYKRYFVVSCPLQTLQLPQCPCYTLLNTGCGC